jgi:hypothetical protein
MENILNFPPAGNGAAGSSTPPCDTEPAGDLANQVRGCILVGSIADYMPVKARPIVRLPDGRALVRHAIDGAAAWCRIEHGAVGDLYRIIRGSR